MPLYEHVVVSRPDMSAQQVDALVEDIGKIVSERNGTIGRTEYWGLRNLAYPINKARKAHYSLVNIDAPADALHEIERRHRINEDVIRYLTVRVEEFGEEASPVIARKDRDDRRRGRRDDEGGGRGGRDFDRDEFDAGDRGDRGGRGRRDR